MFLKTISWLLFLLLGLWGPVRGQGLADSLPAMVTTIRRQIERNKLDSARSLLNRLYAQSGEEHNKALSWYYLLKGNIAKLEGRNEQCLELYQKALYYNEHYVQDPLFYTMAYNEIGILNTYMGEYAKGITHFIKAIQHAAGIPQRRLREKQLTVAYINMAQLLIANGNYQKALYYLDKGMVLSQSNGLYYLQANLVMNQGSCYKALQRPKEAMERYQQALSLSKLRKDPPLEQCILGNIGELLAEGGSYKEAVGYFEKAVQIDSGAIPYYTVANLCQLGAGYLNLKNYARAEHNLRKALALARQYQLGAHLPEIHNSLSRLYEAEGNNGLALAHLKQYIHTEDSISGIERVKNIQQLETRYQSALKDKTLAENKMQLQRKNMMILFLTGLTVSAVLIAYMFFRHRNKLHKRKIRILEQVHEIKAVKATMESEENERIRIARDLHDGIGGMITALNMKISRIQKKYDSRNEEVNQDLQQPMVLIQEIASEIRQTSRNLIPETLLHLGLADALRHYCSYLEDSSRVRFDLLFYGDLEKINHSMALSLYRIVQEIAQNIVKHAQASEAVIQIREHQGTIHFHAEDNGVGFDTKAVADKGRGLVNIRSRVKAMRGYFSLSSSHQSGTTIHIELAEAMAASSGD